MNDRGRFFLRGTAIAVNGLRALWNGPTHVWNASSGVPLIVEKTSLPLSVALPAIPAESSTDKSYRGDASDGSAIAKPQLQDRTIQDEELKSLLKANIHAYDEFARSMNALKVEISTFNQELSRKRKRRSERAPRAEDGSNVGGEREALQHRRTHPQDQDALSPSATMDVDAPIAERNMNPPPRPPQTSRPLKHTLSALSTQQYLEQTVISDDPQDSDFELSDSSRAGGAQGTPQAAAAADEGGTHQVLKPLTSHTTHLSGDNRNPSVWKRPQPTLENLQESAARDRPPQLAKRGGRARRGVSGRQMTSDSSKPISQALPTHLSRDRRPLKLNTAQPKQRRARSSGYRSSPLATSLRVEDADEEAIESSASTPIASPSIAPSSIGAMSHKDIMKLVKKGMKSEFAKSHLLRGPSRAPPRSFSSPSRVALAS